MDDVGLDRELHERALDALGRVNRVSLTAVRAWWEVERLWRAGVQPVRVLDVACGGGDVLMDLEGRALRGGVAVELTGCDMSATALARARASADALAAHRREGHGPVAALRFEIDKDNVFNAFGPAIWDKFIRAKEDIRFRNIFWNLNQI
jgi:ubiquinone/menaquinone biosynthesis C-methylase UbiE